MSSQCSSWSSFNNLFESCPLYPSSEFSTHPLWYLLSIEMSMVNTVPIMIGVILILIFMVKRTRKYAVIACSIVIGIAACELLFKPFMRQNRPFGSCSKTFGMPSGHSWFSGIFLTWGILMYYSKLTTSKLATGLIILYAVNNAFARYYLNYHTVYQIIAGFTWGCVVAITMYALIKPKASAGASDGDRTEKLLLQTELMVNEEETKKLIESPF